MQSVIFIMRQMLKRCVCASSLQQKGHKTHAHLIPTLLNMKYFLMGPHVKHHV